jgi:hypothetical protein
MNIRQNVEKLWEEVVIYFKDRGISVGEITEVACDMIVIANNIFIKNITDPYLNSIDPIIQSNLGCYYFYNNNEEKMIKHYKLAAELGSQHSMVCLIKYYHERKEYKKVSYYYKLLSIKNINHNLEREYAEHLFKCENNRELAKEHFIKSIILGNIDSAIFLRKHYNKAEINWKIITAKLLVYYSEFKHAHLLKCIEFLCEDDDIVKYVFAVVIGNVKN